MSFVLPIFEKNVHVFKINNKIFFFLFLFVHWNPKLQLYTIIVWSMARKNSTDLNNRLGFFFFFFNMNYA